MASILSSIQKLFSSREFEEQVNKIRAVQRTEIDRARKLKEQLTEKKEQVDMLERKVIENERQVDTLQEEINNNRETADQLITGVTIQIQEMIDKLNEQMEALDLKTERQIQQIGAYSTAQMNNVDQKLASLDEIKASVAQISELKATIDKLEELQELSAQLAAVHQSVKDGGRKVDSLRADVGEKIHSENVKCYRNIKSLINDLGLKMNQVNLSEESMHNIRKSFGGWKFFSFFAFLDFVGIAFIIVYMLGLISISL